MNRGIGACLMILMSELKKCVIIIVEENKLEKKVFKKLFYIFQFRWLIYICRYKMLDAYQVEKKKERSSKLGVFL